MTLFFKCVIINTVYSSFQSLKPGNIDGDKRNGSTSMGSCAVLGAFTSQ